jgi:hypothetical protein
MAVFDVVFFPLKVLPTGYLKIEHKIFRRFFSAKAHWGGFVQVVQDNAVLQP